MSELQDRSYDLLSRGGIKFTEETHEYTNSDGVVYNSSTGILKQYKNPFDDVNMSKYKAIKEVLSYEKFNKLKRHAGGWDKVHKYWDKLLEREEFKKPLLKKRKAFLDVWEKAGKDAVLAGSIEHAKREEEIIKNGFYWNNKYYPYADKTVLDIKNSDICAIPELLLWDHDIQLGGLADLPLFYNGVVDVHDFKTNKEISMTGFNGQKLRGILSHVPDCSFYLYSIQLEIYSRMIQDLTGFKRGENWIISTANPEYGRKEDVYIKCADMQKEVEMIYEYYGKNK